VFEAASAMLRRSLEQRLQSATYVVSRNVAPPADTPPGGTYPVFQPEVLDPAPDLIVFVALDLQSSPRVTFWFVSAADYLSGGVNNNPQAKQVLALP
jgi:hypothetical protein